MTCVHADAPVRLCVLMHTCVRGCMPVRLCVHVYTCVQVCMPVHLCMRMHTCIQVCMRACVRMCMYQCMHGYGLTHLNTCTNTHPCAYTLLVFAHKHPSHCTPWSCIAAVAMGELLLALPMSILAAPAAADVIPDAALSGRNSVGACAALLLLCLHRPKGGHAVTGHKGVRVCSCTWLQLCTCSLHGHSGHVPAHNTEQHGRHISLCHTLLQQSLR